MDNTKTLSLRLRRGIQNYTNPNRLGNAQLFYSSSIFWNCNIVSNFSSSCLGTDTRFIRIKLWPISCIKMLSHKHIVFLNDICSYVNNVIKPVSMPLIYLLRGHFTLSFLIMYKLKLLLSNLLIAFQLSWFFWRVDTVWPFYTVKS